MTQPRPTAPEMLEAIREFLTDELLSTLDGRLRFLTRVAANALEVVERELVDGPTAADAERQRLISLLSAAADENIDPGDERVDTTVTALSRELAGRIRDGSIDIDDPALVEHLKLTARADVAIANPKWLPVEG